MHKSSVSGKFRAGRQLVESETPCLVFEATRARDGALKSLRCVGWNPSAEACALVHGTPCDMERWVKRVEGLLDGAACARALDTGEPYLAELHCELGGTESWWQATAVPRGEGFSLWLKNVTDARCKDSKVREALERALAREERMAEEAAFRERFIGVLGHDLRNPLSAVMVSVRALCRYGSLSSTQQELGQRIEASAGRMSKMISDILDLTRARQSGGIPLFLMPMQLSTMCQQVVGELSAASPDRCILYDAQGDSEGVWDAERLAQVLSNLVSNALEHGGEEVPVIVRSYSQGDMQALEVHNPGPPIPADRLATLFEPFQQGSPLAEGKRKRRGLGLGLYIVKELVQAHGGQVSVHSAGEGTTFTVLLPRDARQVMAGNHEQQEQTLWSRR
ncbi:sensor histidine kinase [Stigmatella aurantiaca]|uniref:histidine kinase n=1 Tax=Stigmatella aurantiaca (strain DW4/3-1) TaxID=378806 RepID=Q091Q2_STIAD|nr:HAMP domain-containing sensor histidine kinase [Stigmatella aurantiaca]ADO68648.1 Sensor protein [Stigmatella aurantiaca DW4/3-1]EAU66453.1 SdeK [Stigmatella aurantiaca DW4/3-1]